MIEEVMEEMTKIISPIYLVGGAVRDYVMKREINDFDFTTPLTPDEILDALHKGNPGRWVGEIGKRFGTIQTKIYLPKSDCFVKVEVTTFRAEVYTDGSRKPEVKFTKHLHEDLSRRDFTINAMAIRIRDGKMVIIDPFGGLDDIENHTIRAVGSARTRFKEDPLRMLRGIRFASTLDFGIEEITMKRMTDGAIQILNVSKERWMLELDKILMSDESIFGLTLLADSRLINYMIPELAIQVDYNQMTPHHDFTLWEHTVKVVAACPKDIILRWAALLHDVGKPYVAKVKDNNPGQKNYMGHELIGAEMVGKIGPYLKWKTDQTKAVMAMVKNHLDDKSPLKGYDSGAQKRMEEEPSCSNCKCPCSIPYEDRDHVCMNYKWR
jgi:putative nucleotidyltransferase with HDIG domain